MNILSAFLAGFILMYALWLFYLAVMSLKSARDNGRLTPWGKVFGYPVFLVGYALDVIGNFTVMSIIMLELPHEFVITDRVTRHIHDGAGFRYAIANWFCKNLLDPYDPSGCHCK